MLERGTGCRQIARGLGRSPSTVSGEVASHRFVTAPWERHGERRRLGRPLGSLPVPHRLPAMLQRLRAIPRDRLQEEAARLLRRPRGTALRRSHARLLQARNRCGRAGRGRGARPHPRLPAARAIPRADVGPQRRPHGPAALDHLQAGRRRLRRYDEL